MIDSFEATVGLEDGALQRLLEEGRPEERVWAAWRIALRVGGAMPHIVDHVIGEPSAGVRRALLVILAGHREYDVLVALARHDPAIEVRAQAMQMVTGLAAQGAIAMAVVADAYREGPAAVRCAILSAVPAAEATPWRSFVSNGLRAVTPDEQIEAFDAALRLEDADLRSAALGWLGHAPQAVEEEAWRRARVVEVTELVAGLRGGDAKLETRRIEPLLQAPLEALGSLVRDDDWRAFEILRAHRDLRDASAELCARAVLADCEDDYAEILLGHLERGGLASTWPDRLVSHLAPRLEALERAPWPQYDLDDEHENRIECYRGLLELLRSSRG